MSTYPYEPGPHHPLYEYSVERDEQEDDRHVFHVDEHEDDYEDAEAQ